MISKPNCSILYTLVQQDLTGNDPVTDEPIFETTETTEGFRASIEKDTVEATFGIQKGKDLTEHFYSGKASLKPSEMPLWYQPGCSLIIKFDTGFEAQGYVYFAHESRLGLDDLFGTTLELILRY